MGGDREEGAAERSGGPRPHGLRLADLLTVGGESDESGRLLLEDSAPVTARRRARRAGIEMDTVTYAHRDSPSRTGGRMNRSAYEALRRDTAAIFDGFAWLRARTLRTGAVEEGTVALLTTLSKLGITLPLVAFHRVRDPVPRHGALPTFAASIFKAGRGLYSATVDMAGRQGAGARPTAAEVLAFAE